MRTHHHRAPGSQRRSGVAARDRKCEREIGRAEYGHRAKRNVAQAQVGARQRLTIRQRGFERRTDPIAFAQDLRKQAQLAAGAPQFAGYATDRQPGFGHCARDNAFYIRLKPVGDPLQKRGAHGGRQLAIGVECGFGQLACLGYIGSAADCKFAGQCRTVQRSVCDKTVVTGSPLRTDPKMSFHARLRADRRSTYAPASPCS